MNDLVFVMCNLNLINKPTKKATGTTQVSLGDIFSDDEWIAPEESPDEPNEEWPSVFHRDAQEEDENGKWVLNLVSYDLWLPYLIFIKFWIQFVFVLFCELIPLIKLSTDG